MGAKPEIKDRQPLPGMELAPMGQVKDPDGEGYVPRGDMILRDAMDKPMDLEANLKRFQQNRVTIHRFCAKTLREAEYDAKNELIPGKLNDYYLVPGAKTKALTKKGAENLAQLFRYAKGRTEVISHVETKEYCSAVVSVTLLDHYRREVGSAVGACSTGEKGFSSINAQKKYGAVYLWKGKDQPQEMKQAPDYRAALNDVVARAGKRSFVQAVIYATATDEIFHAAADAGEEEPGQTVEPSGGAAAFPLPFDTREYKRTQGKEGYKRGTPIGQISDEKLLATLFTWCREQGKHSELGDAISELLEARRAGSEETP